MKKTYAYKVIIAEIKTGELKELVVKGNTNINEGTNILQVISKFQEILVKRNINPLDWTLVKLEKISGVTEKDYIEFNKNRSNIIKDSNDISNIRKLIVQNLTDRSYIFKFEYKDEKIMITVYDSESTDLPGGISIRLQPNRYYNLRRMIGKIMDRRDFNKIIISNKFNSDEPLYIKDSVIEDIISDDEVVISVIDYKDNPNNLKEIFEIKSGENVELIVGGK